MWLSVWRILRCGGSDKVLKKFRELCGMEDLFLKLRAWFQGVEFAKCDGCGWKKVGVNAKSALGGHKGSCNE